MAKLQRLGAAHRDQHLEALVARKSIDHARVMRIVLDDQQDGVAWQRSRAGRLECGSIGRSGNAASCTPGVAGRSIGAGRTERAGVDGPTYFSGR